MGNTYCNYNNQSDKVGIDLINNESGSAPIKRPTVTEENTQPNITETAVKDISKIENMKKGVIEQQPGSGQSEKAAEKKSLRQNQDEEAKALIARASARGSQQVEQPPVKMPYQGQKNDVPQPRVELPQPPQVSSIPPEVEQQILQQQQQLQLQQQQLQQQQLLYAQQQQQLQEQIFAQKQAQMHQEQLYQQQQLIIQQQQQQILMAAAAQQQIPIPQQPVLISAPNNPSQTSNNNIQQNSPQSAPMSGPISNRFANDDIKQHQLPSQQIIQRDSQSATPVQSVIKSGLPGTLFEKIGGEEGMRTFVDKIFSKVMEDKTLRPFFTSHNTDMDKLKQHFGMFMTHMTNTTEAEWTGKSLANDHRHYPITDEIFDAFNSHCISSIKEMRKLKTIDQLREMMNMLKQLRDMVVIKDEPQKYDISEEVKRPEHQPGCEVTMQEEIGGYDKVLQIASTMFEMIKSDQSLNHFFHYTGYQKHACRFAQFLTYLTGGHEEWVGLSVDTIHAGRFISEEHFELFMIYFQRAMVINQIQDTNGIYGRMSDALRMCKNLIVFEQEQNLSFYMQLNYNGKFDQIMSSFADIISKDPLFSEFFKQNIMIKQLICSLITNFFHLQSQGMQESMKLDTFGIKLNGEMFQRSLEIFKDACKTQQLNPILLEQAQIIYQKLEPYINIPMSIRQISEEIKSPLSSAQNQANFQMNTQQNYSKVVPQTPTLPNEIVLPKNSIPHIIVEHMNTNPASNPTSIAAYNSMKNESIAIDFSRIKPPHFVDQSSSNNNDLQPLQILSEQNQIEEQKQAPHQVIKDTDIEDVDEHSNVGGPDEEVLHKQLSKKDIAKIENQCKYESLPSNESQRDTFKNKPSQQASEQEQEINFQESPSRPELLRSTTENQEKPRAANNVVLEELKEQTEAPSSDQVTPYVTPVNSNQIQQYFELKGVFQSVSFQQIVMNHIIHEGELSKQIERQKSLLTRWIILNKDALLIYKDKLNSRSFPEKPLLCIPLIEIQSVKENEVQKKGVKNVHTELIINLRDCLSNIEQKVRQHFDYKVSFGVNFSGTQRNHSKNDDTQIDFFSNVRKDVTVWVKKINSIIKPSKKQIQNSLLKDLQGEPLNLNIRPQPLFSLANEFLQPVAEQSDQIGSAEVVTEQIMQILQFMDGVQDSVDIKKDLLHQLISNIESVMKKRNFQMTQEQEEKLNQLKTKIQLKEESLYNRIGGKAAIHALVEGMYQKIFYDPELQDFFKKTDKEHQKEMQRLFLTYATGGPSEYLGKVMKDAHKGRGIGEKEFNLVAGHVVSSLSELKVPQLLIDEVVSLLIPLKGEVADEQIEEIKQEQSLYDKLGGSSAIQAVVEGMYQKIFNDPELSDFFKKTDKEHQKLMQIQFLSYATGGPSSYSGKDMTKAHEGRGIGGHEFDLVAGHVVKTMQELGVSEPLQQEVVNLLVPLKQKIVLSDE